MKILSIDYGEKRVGFAVGDSSIKSSTPLPAAIIKGNEDLIRIVNNLISDYGIDKIVLGNPVNMDGSQSAFAGKVNKIAGRLRSETGLEVILTDERLSSFEAEEILSKISLSFKKKKELIDSVSAHVILKRYLEEK